MTRSMTGVGHAAGRAGTAQIAADVRSVNHRFLEVKVKLPGEAAGLEPDLRRMVAGAAARGRVDLAITVMRADGGARLRVNRPLLSAFLRETRALRKDLRLAGEPDLPLLLGLPGVVRVESAGSDLSRREVAAVRKVAAQALERMRRTREREGAALARDVRRRVAAIRRHVRAIRSRAAAHPQRAAARLRERIARLAEGVDLDPARLAHEVAVLADRADISEEIVRLEAHLAALEGLLGADGATVGREMEFLVQELHRETNTIHSKCSDLEISRRALAVKSEVERVREQVQNIE